MYWFPKLHKRPYKAKFIANSSAYTTIEHSKSLTSCLTAIKIHIIRLCEKCTNGQKKKMFLSIKISTEVLDKLNFREFCASSFSAYDFSTL